MARASEAAARRRQRDEQARLRQLQRQAKDSARSSALEAARLEVEIYHAQISMLLSVHKDQTAAIDWRSVVASLPPAEPSRRRHRELRARQDEVLAAAGLSPFAAAWYSGALADARGADDHDYRQAVERYSAERDDWAAGRELAGRVLAGNTTAYQDVLTQRILFTDAPDVGAVATVTAHDRHLAEVQLLVQGRDVLPAETKMLTSTGKVSVKPTAKGKFHEMCQDYVASCVIRAARELFGLLPFDKVLVTASLPTTEFAAKDAVGSRPVLSVIFPRGTFSALPFDTLDPSDTVELFPHRGDVKASRKTAEFTAILPLTRDDLPRSAAELVTLEAVVAAARNHCIIIEDELRALAPTARDVESPMEEE